MFFFLKIGTRQYIKLTLDFFLVAQVLQQGRPSVQDRLVLHPVVVKEEERLLTLLLQGQRGAIAPGLGHLQQVGTGAQPGAAGSAHLHPLNIDRETGENAHRLWEAAPPRWAV